MLTNLRLAQIYAILRLELKKTFFARRGLWVYLLAAMPLVLYAGHSLLMLKTHRPCDFGLDTTIFAEVFQMFYLRLAVFFGCLGIFMNLFRGEVLDKSLHFYFLAPVRREVLMAGKFTAGLLVAMVTFCLSVILQFAALYAHYDWNTVEEYLARGHGWMHLFSYVGVTGLACIGYGSVFLAAGILIRNPIVPAATILIWEAVESLPAGHPAKVQRDLLPEIAVPHRGHLPGRVCARSADRECRPRLAPHRHPGLLLWRRWSSFGPDARSAPWKSATAVNSRAALRLEIQVHSEALDEQRVLLECDSAAARSTLYGLRTFCQRRTHTAT